MGIEVYQRAARKNILLILILCMLTSLLALYFCVIGMENASMSDVFSAVAHWSMGDGSAASISGTEKIILLLRMPRVCLALSAGAGLAISGAIMQSITRNYLVSPFTLGISSSAAFGAALYIVLFSSHVALHEYGMITSAFITSLLCGVGVYGIAKRLGLRPTSLVLVGIALNYLFGAAVSVLEFFAQEHKLEAVVQWTFGSLNRADWSNAVISSAVVLVGIIALLLYRLRFNALAASSDETVSSLGINPTRLRAYGGLIAVFMTAAIISFTGVIGFVGLIAPHMARLVVGNDHRFYLPASAVLGAFLLLVSDAIGRLVLYPVTVPVGIVISFLGVPLFIHLILLKGKTLR